MLLRYWFSKSKSKKYDKYPKLRDADFDFENIQKRFVANVYLLNLNDFIHFNEPEELKLVMNEIYTYLKGNNYDNVFILDILKRY